MSDHTCRRPCREQRCKSNGCRQNPRPEDRKLSCSPETTQILVPQYPGNPYLKDKHRDECSQHDSRDQDTSDLPEIYPADLLFRSAYGIQKPHLADVSCHRDLHHVMDQKEHAAKDHNRAKQRHAITARHPAHRIAFQCVTCPDFKIFSFLCHILIQPLFGLPPVHAVRLADQDVRFLFYLISPFPAFCLRDVSSPRIGRGVYMIRVPSAQIEFLLHLPEESYANQETELHSFPGFFDPHGFHHTDRKHDLLLFCRITAMNVCICRADHLLPCKCI